MFRAPRSLVCAAGGNARRWPNPKGGNIVVRARTFGRPPSSRDASFRAPKRLRSRLRYPFAPLFPVAPLQAPTPRRVTGADECGVYHERVSNHRARTTLRPASLSSPKKIFRARSDGISRLRGHTTRARKIPPKIGPLEKKASPLALGKDSIRRRRLGDGLSGDCLPLKQEQSRPLTWQTNRRQVFCLSERQNCETDERRSAGAALKVRKITWACARARDLPSTPHRLARAAGGDSRVEPTTRARAHRVAAKAGKGWPWTRGELRDTRSSDGPTLRYF